MRIIWLLLFAFWFSYSGLILACAHKEELHLVIGSIRENLPATSKVISAMHDYEHADCSHLNTFGGEACTFDLLPCKDASLKHLVGDATTYDFSPYLVKSSYLERVPTTNAQGDNIIGDILRNLLPHFENHAKIYIELDPFLNFYFGEDFEMLEEKRRDNPFHASYSFDIMSNVLKFLRTPAWVTKYSLGIELSSSTIQEILKEKDEFTTWLETLVQKTNLNPTDLERRFNQEMNIYRLLAEKRPDEKILVSLFGDGPNQDFAEFDFTYEHAATYSTPTEYANFFIHHCLENRSDYAGYEYPCHFYDLCKFFSLSVTNRILSLYAVHKNKDAIKTYMEQLGFVDVKCEFTDSPINHRKNIWLISAQTK